MGSFFAALAIIGGMALIVGGFKKWPWLVEPTERNVFRHPLAFTSMFVPQRWLKWAAVVVGVVWIAAGLFVICAER